MQNADDIKAKGVDTIACLSVNDVFVMGAWANDQGAGDKVTLLADGNADYTKALGLDLDASGFGMGTRGQRFALVVEDGVELERPDVLRGRGPGGDRHPGKVPDGSDREICGNVRNQPCRCCWAHLLMDVPVAR